MWIRPQKSCLFGCFHDGSMGGGWLVVGGGWLSARLEPSGVGGSTCSVNRRRGLKSVTSIGRASATCPSSCTHTHTHTHTRTRTHTLTLAKERRQTHTWIRPVTMGSAVRTTGLWDYGTTGLRMLLCVVGLCLSACLKSSLTNSHGPTCSHKARRTRRKIHVIHIIINTQIFTLKYNNW